jgi:hypothetical protein
MKKPIVVSLPSMKPLLGLLIAGLACGQTWRLDRVDRVGGIAATVEGHPRLIDTPAGKAVAFDGGKDALFLNVHPLAGADKWTWEVVFRPDEDGKAEQRFFHLQEEGTDDRRLFEIRIIGGKWCLDSFAKSGTESKALMDRAKLHPAGTWHHAAAVYDGREFRNYVDGKLENAGEVKLEPQKPGRTSIGTRINRVDYFKGAIFLARFTRRPLAPSEFVKMPAKLQATR